MADSDSKPKKRRIIREAETLREKTAKAGQTQSNEDKRQKRGIIGGALYYLAWPLRFVGRQIAKLERFKVFRIIGYILVPPYLRNSWGELKQVTWPNRRETFQLTLAVLAFAVVFGILVTTVDYGLEKIFKRILLGE